DKTGDAFAKLEVDVTSALAVVAGAEAIKVRQSQEGVPIEDRSRVARFDRTEEAFDGGFRFTLGSGWTLAPEVQQTTTWFVRDQGQRNSTSLAGLLAVSFSRPQFYLNLVGGYREGDPKESTFPHYATPVGSFFVSYFVRPWLEIRPYGRRRVAYSVDLVNPYYFQMLAGGTINIQVANRILLKGVGAVGQNKYTVAQFVPGEQNQVVRLD